MELNEKMTESMNDPNAHRSPGAPMNDTRLLSGQSRYSDYPVMSSTSNRTGWEISHLTEDKWSLRISFSLEHEDSGSLDWLQWWNISFKEISFELFIAYGWALSSTTIRIMVILNKCLNHSYPTDGLCHLQPDQYKLRNFIWSFVCHLEYLLFKLLGNMNLF